MIDLSTWTTPNGRKVSNAFPDAVLAPVTGDAARGHYSRWLVVTAGPREQAIVNRSLGVTQDADR